MSGPTPHDGSSHRSRSRRAFTFLEVLIALAITAMIGAAVSTMLLSVSVGTRQRSDLRRNSVRAKVVAARVGAALRSSRLVLASADDALVLWMGDTRANGVPDLSELVRLEWDSEGLELWSYTAPETLAMMADTTYTLTDDFDSITFDLAGGVTFPGQRWGTGISQWSTTLDEPVPQRADIVHYTFVVSGAETSMTIDQSAALRSR